MNPTVSDKVWWIISGQEAPPVIGCRSPHQHNGFLPDLLCLDCLLVLATCRSDAETVEDMGKKRGSEWEMKRGATVNANESRRESPSSSETKAHSVKALMSAATDCLAQGNGVLIGFRGQDINIHDNASWALSSFIAAEHLKCFVAVREGGYLRPLPWIDAHCHYHYKVRLGYADTIVKPFTKQCTTLTIGKRRLGCWPVNLPCSVERVGRSRLHSRWLPAPPLTDRGPPHTPPSAPSLLQGHPHCPPPPPLPPGRNKIRKWNDGNLGRVFMCASLQLSELPWTLSQTQSCPQNLWNRNYNRI